MSISLERSGTPRSARGQEVGTPTSRSGSSVQAAFWVFVAVELTAGILWLAQSRSRWFFRDEWAFLVDRSALSPYDLIDDHNSHWSTVPILVYRGLWELFGLRSYLPYLAVTVLAHVAAAALLRVVMRRAGVNPWIATTAASLFALFGAGYQNVVWAFQIGFSGALALGLGYVVLTDHDGPFDRRDWLGMAAGLGALMSSSVGVALVAAAIAAILIRRGWRVALVHASLLGSIYGLWWIAIGRVGPHPGRWDATPVEVARFAWVGLQGAFGNLGQLPGLGLVLGALFLGGLVLSCHGAELATFRHRVAAPAALVFGAFVFLVATGYTRVGYLGPEFARASRYQYIVAALLLPALALALDAIARRWRPLVPAFCVLLVLGIPGNVDALSDGVHKDAAMLREFRHLVLAIPRTKAAARVPPSIRPFSSLGGEGLITVGWLRDAVASGRLPRPYAVTKADEIIIRFALSLAQSHVERRPTNCRDMTNAVRRHLDKGDTITFLTGKLEVTPAPGTAANRVESLIGTTAFEAKNGERLTAVLEPVDVVLREKNPFFFPVRLCDEEPNSEGARRVRESLNR
jgi:hypothetical protein